MIEVRPATPEDADFVGRTLAGWHGPYVAVHGELIDASTLPALIAWRGEEPAGLLVYRPDARGCEIVILESLVREAGAGGALIAAMRTLARESGAAELWLVTSNDNTDALRFYQRQGFDLVALHRDAVTAARALKPSIPERSGGIAKRHELELRLDLGDLTEPA